MKIRILTVEKIVAERLGVEWISQEYVQNENRISNLILEQEVINELVSEGYENSDPSDLSIENLVKIKEVFGDVKIEGNELKSDTTCYPLGKIWFGGNKIRVYKQANKHSEKYFQNCDFIVIQ